MAQLETIVKNYRALAQIPTVLSGHLMQNEVVVNSTWSIRNLELEKRTKSFICYNLGPRLEPIAQSIALDVSNELLSKISPSGKYRAVIRECDTKDGQKQFLEIWHQMLLMNCVDLSAADVHADVYADGEFSSLQWSPDEKKLIYIAEKKGPKAEPFYKRKPLTDKNDTVKGEEYKYRQDWGEQLVKKKQSVIALYNVTDDNVEVLEGIPENTCPAQIIWGPDGNTIFGMALKTEPRKLGLIYCSNRLSTIFSLDLQGNYVEIEMANKAVKSPIITVDGKELLWLQREAGGPHASTMSLVKTCLPINSMSKVETIVDVVQKQKKINNDKTFYGLYNNKLSSRCWISERRLVLSTNQRNTINSYVIDIDTGNITELPYENGSLIVLDVSNDVVLAVKRNFFISDVLTVGKMPMKGQESSIEWKDITEGILNEDLKDNTCHYIDIDVNDPIVNEFTAIYLGPKSAPEHSVPLIIWPHGGPHSSYANGWALETSLFMQLGYAVLLINYRGSIGAGKDNVEFLLGKIGSSDVNDCYLALGRALKKFEWLDERRVVVVGGSHGGFLATHLSGQFPDIFKAVVARNPVIDVASMSIISDIPDWCHVEAGSEYTQIGEPNNDLLLKMRKASPIQHAHKVRAPTLLQIGSKDLRVPPSQAMEYYHRLKANKIPVEMNLYDDNHPLDKLPNEMNNIINTVLWIEKHIQSE